MFPSNGMMLMNYIHVKCSYIIGMCRKGNTSSSGCLIFSARGSWSVHASSLVFRPQSGNIEDNGNRNWLKTTLSQGTNFIQFGRIVSNNIVSIKSEIHARIWKKRRSGTTELGPVTQLKLVTQRVFQKALLTSAWAGSLCLTDVETMKARLLAGSVGQRWLHVAAHGRWWYSEQPRPLNFILW